MNNYFTSMEELGALTEGVMMNEAIASLGDYGKTFGVEENMKPIRELARAVEAGKISDPQRVWYYRRMDFKHLIKRLLVALEGNSGADYEKELNDEFTWFRSEIKQCMKQFPKSAQYLEQFLKVLESPVYRRTYDDDFVRRP